MSTATKKHNFNFAGGNYLRTICASYYVCYLYWLNIDLTEKRWQKVASIERRNRNIIMHTAFCKLWLEEIAKMKKVGTNSMGLTVDEVHKYAEALLKLKVIKFE